MGPLKGVKVLDLTSMVSGPMGAMMLADQGAEVIKVEPVNGELVRHMAAQHNGVNAPFFSCNRGKKSLAIDLKSEEGKEILLKLAAEADVLGTFSVSVEVILISSVESPSSLAAICEILVIKPCPISIPP